MIFKFKCYNQDCDGRCGWEKCDDDCHKFDTTEVTIKDVETEEDAVKKVEKILKRDKYKLILVG